LHIGIADDKYVSAFYGDIYANDGWLAGDLKLGGASKE
jgi:hypothetical protein